MTAAGPGAPLPPRGVLEDKAIRGVPWTVLTYASSKVVSVGTTVVLARLLVPEDFGLVALATVSIGAFALFNDLGLGGVLVVAQNLDERAKGTILTLMLAMGGVIALAVIAASPLVADLFDQPRLTPVLAALAATIVIGALTWFYETLLQRELEFSRRFRALMGQTLTYSVVAIVAAALGAGVWSLVAGQLAASLAYAGLLLYLVPDRVRPAFDRESARTTLREGRAFVAQGGLAFVELNADYLAVGRLLGTAQLGYYSMAFRLAELPYWAVTEPVAKVTFPGFARMTGRGEAVEGSFLSVLRLVALVACPIGVLLSAAADPFTRTLLGTEWLPMIGPLAILGIWGAISQVEASLGWLLNSVGAAGRNARISAVAVLPLVPGVIVAAHLGDIAWVAWVLLAHVLLSLAVRMLFVSRDLNIGLSRQWGAIRPVLGASLGAWAVARMIAESATGLPASGSLALSIAGGLTAYAGVSAVIERGALTQALKQLRRTLAKP